MLGKLWDDVLAGPQPERGLGRLRKITNDMTDMEGGQEGRKFERSMSMPMPASPGTPSSPASSKDNVWRSVFNPGSNLATKSIGAEVFDKPHANSPTVYDWLYSGDTKSEHR